jgi:hypothetical protein
MSKWKVWLRQPIALETGTLARYRQAVFFGAFVFLFLFTFQPFGLNGTGPDLLRLTLGYGVVCFTVMIFLNVFLMRVFPNYFEEDHWTLGRDIFWNIVNILTIGFFNLLFSAWIGIAKITWKSILYLEFYTLLVAIFPVTVAIFWKERLLRLKHEKASDAIRSIHVIHPREGNEILIPSENDGESFHVQMDNLLYLQSAENYIEVYFLQENDVKKAVIRYTLKQICNDWNAYPALYRCHKSFLINLRHIEEVSGNAQGLKVKLKSVERLIPVSRQLTKDIRERLEQL